MADGTQFPPRVGFLPGSTADAARNRDSRHPVEPHSARLSSRLRAAVLGANDGIVPVAGHHGAWPHIHRWAGGPGGRRGVDGAPANMCRVESARQRQGDARPGPREVPEMPAAQLDELAAIYGAKGVSSQTAAQVAAELTAHDALGAHVDVELRLDPDDLADPLQAAAASAASFTVGAL